MYIFSGKIRCKKCGKNFKGIHERRVPKYICSGYSNYGKEFCTRFKVNEEKLIYIVNTHIDIQKLKKGIKLGGSRGRGRPKKEDKEKSNKIDLNVIQNYTELILVDPINEIIEIYYKDNTKSYVSPDRVIY